MMKNQEERWLLEEGFQGVESKAFHAALVRLRAGAPLAYLIGHVPFLNCTIYLDKQPLIPRAETEFWVDKAISYILKPKSPYTKLDFFELAVPQPNPPTSKLSVAEFGAKATLTILDLCAGSGAIGVAVAKAMPETRVDFAEIDARLLPTIEKNIQANAIDPLRTNVIQSDLFANISGSYDFILTNPPYIDPALDRTETSVKNHEPHLALYGGIAGMGLIERIIKEARVKLAPHGQLWIEHEPEQTAAIHTLSSTHGFAATTNKDQYNIERYSILVLQ